MSKSLELLSVNFTDDAIHAMKAQSEQLIKFVKAQLKEDVDFATLPGTPKPTLLKPGAEKLAKIFRLGSRVMKEDTIINHEKQFGISTVIVEVFLIRTGSAIAQCVGSANTFEPSHKNKPYPMALNHVLKIALKRAFVGAVVMAVGASDFFTQDVEDMVVQVAQEEAVVHKGKIEAPPPAKITLVENPDTGAYRIPFGRDQGKRLDELTAEELDKLEKWVISCEHPTGKVLSCKQAIERYRKG